MAMASPATWGEGEEGRKGGGKGEEDGRKGGEDGRKGEEDGRKGEERYVVYSTPIQYGGGIHNSPYTQQPIDQ